MDHVTREHQGALEPVLNATCSRLLEKNIHSFSHSFLYLFKKWLNGAPSMCQARGGKYTPMKTQREVPAGVELRNKQKRSRYRSWQCSEGHDQGDMAESQAEDSGVSLYSLACQPGLSGEASLALITKGWKGAVGAAGRTLPQGSGDPSQVGSALTGLWRFCFYRPPTLSGEFLHLQKEHRVPQAAPGLGICIIMNLLTEE